MTDEPHYLSVTSAAGGDLEVLVDGPPDGFTLLYHSGTPSAAVPFPMLRRACDAHGMRLVTWSRPGYGRSEPRTSPATVADDVADAERVLDAVGAVGFVTLGWSGGGPRALACAALLPGHCRAAVSLAGVAPRDADGLDWAAGMGQENLEEFAAADRGPDALHVWLEGNGSAVFHAEPGQLAEGLGDIAPPVDRAAMTGELLDHLAASFRHAGRQGVVGWRDDDLALTRPWGFDLGAITVPVGVWQGSEDRMVPVDHGRWLADHVGSAHPRLEQGAGHISLVTRIDRMVDDLVDLAGL
jgi:pimeloyl-ACP methyl ester carboxylesterase